MQYQSDHILREPQVHEITKLSKSTRWRLEKAGMFPKKIHLSANAVGWKHSDILLWVNERIELSDLIGQTKTQKNTKQSAMEG